jgi:hypothetical protein
MSCVIAFIATVCFVNLERFFNGVFIKVIENSISALSIETAIDHLLLCP